GGLLLVGEELVVGHGELDGRALDAGHLPDGLGDLALQRALVGDLLLEVAGAELLGVELVPPAARRAAGRAQALAGQRDARLGHVGRGDLDGGAAVGQLVADARAVERGGDLARRRRVLAGRHGRVAGLRGRAD